jgi:hypothetical protein
MSDDEASWQERRRSAAEEHLAAIDRRKAAEVEQARAQVADFVSAAITQGLATTTLRARSFNGRTTYRTQVVGWYVRRNRSLGIGTDGEFYVLSTPASLRARVTGAVVRPSAPPLIVGVGGRDGESMPLAELLQMRLDAGDGWTADGR